MSAAAAAGQDSAENAERQFYINYMHGDCHKDHGGKKEVIDIVIQGFLPDSLLNKQEGQTDKETLFNTIIQSVNNSHNSNSISYFQNITDTSGTVEVDLFGKPTYTFKVFSRNDYADSSKVKQISDFMGETGEIIKIIDTTVDAELVYKNWPGDNLIHAHTREVQMDPAFKKTPDSTGKPSIFYYEPETSTQAAVYPDYSYGNKLSYFYCKHPVYIIHSKKLQAGKQYNLQGLVFEYVKLKQGKTLSVMNGGNTAGATIVSSLLAAITCGKYSPQTVAEYDDFEKRLLSKAHGDISQILVPYRPMELKGYENKNTLYTQDKYHVFESYDINTITKAFSVGLDCIWMHIVKKGQESKLVIFKKDTGERNENEIIMRKIESVKSLLEKVRKEKKYYSEHFGNTDGSIKDFKTKSERESKRFKNTIPERIPRIGTNEAYKEILLYYTKISVLSLRLPAMEDAINKIRILSTKYRKSAAEAAGDAMMRIEDILDNATSIVEDAINEYNTNDENNDEEIDTTKIIENLSKYESILNKYLENIRSLNTIIPSSSKIMKDVDTFAEVTAKEVVLENKKLIYNDIYASIDLFQDINLTKRISTIQQSRWGIDIIHTVHRNLSSYSQILADEFLDNLDNCLDEEKAQIFVALLKLIDLKVPDLEGSEEEESEEEESETFPKLSYRYPVYRGSVVNESSAGSGSAAPAPAAPAPAAPGFRLSSLLPSWLVSKPKDVEKRLESVYSYGDEYPPISAEGGSRYTKTTYKKSKRRNRTSKKYKQKGGDINITNIYNTVYSEIEDHVNFLCYITYQQKLHAATDEDATPKFKKGLQNAFARRFGDIQDAKDAESSGSSSSSASASASAPAEEEHTFDFTLNPIDTILTMLENLKTYAENDMELQCNISIYILKHIVIQMDPAIEGNSIQELIESQIERISKYMDKGVVEKVEVAAPVEAPVAAPALPVAMVTGSEPAAGPQAAAQPESPYAAARAAAARAAAAAQLQTLPMNNRIGVFEEESATPQETPSAAERAAAAAATLPQNTDWVHDSAGSASSGLSLTERGSLLRSFKEAGAAGAAAGAAGPAAGAAGAAERIEENGLASLKVQRANPLDLGRLAGQGGKTERGKETSNTNTRRQNGGSRSKKTLKAAKSRKSRNALFSKTSKRKSI